MTSSLRSRYRLRWAPRGSRRCLYLSGSRLTAYQWRRGTLVEALLFQRSDEGLADFAAYLEADPETPAHLLLDLVEEEYRRDTIPHVLGRDRRNLIRYRVERAFRDTPYWHGVVQGRESEGRRDDNLLMCAVTGPALVKPWVGRLLEHKVPLVGIHSLALVSGSVLPVLGVTSGETLLVSLQSTGNLRQSFFVDGDLKLSRLAHMPLLAPEGVVETTIDEVEKLRRYLNSLRLLRREGVLQVYVLAHGPVLDELRRQCVSGPTTAYHVVDLAELAERLRMNPAFVTPYADAVFAQQVLVERPRNHYASSGETRYFTFYRVRNALRASGVALLLAGVVGGGLGVTEGLVLERRARSAAQQADFYAARYEEARGDLPQTPVDPTDLRAAAETVDALARVRATPLPLLAAVSLALEAHPELQVDQVEWRVDTDPEASIGQTRGGAVAPARGARPGTVPRPEGGPYHLAVVSGRVMAPEGAFRQALDVVHGLVSSLRAQPGVRDVRILTQPLNVDPSESLRGDLETQPGAGRNDFSVRVVFRGGDAPA